MRRETVCVHAGEYLDAETGGVNSPIFTSTAYEYLGCEEPLYQRYFNTPNQEAVVEKLCMLEEAEDGIVCASGMSAISTALLSFAQAGDHVVLQDDLYGGTHAFAEREFPRLGIDCTFAPSDSEGLQAALTDKTTVLYLETPTNPLLKIIDLRAMAEIARQAGVVTIVDNTFASPINQTPLPLGIDVVVHSGTKYLGGHSDLQCGAVLARRELMEQIRDIATHFGGSLNAESCYLMERSMKTLSLRVERQTANAMQIAQTLAELPQIGAVYYPGLPNHPGHDLAREQMKGFGAMLSFELADPTASASEYMGRLQMIHPALSLGGVETKICAPATASHRTMDPEARRRIGVSDQLLRLSVGIENTEDILADLQQAMG